MERKVVLVYGHSHLSINRVTLDEMHIAVIGAGASGLPSIKTCIDYGLDVVCFEKSDDIGGLWRYKPNHCKGEGSVMKSTVINTSKEMTAYSDYPPPSDAPNYMHNRRLLDYFRSYADHFQLLKHVRFRHEVVAIRRADDYDQTGRWIVSYRDLRSDICGMDIFDGVMLASGHHTIPYLPTEWPDQARFRGRIIHSHDYKDHCGYEDQRVVVVGVGNSGADIAVELSKIAQQVYLSTRTGTWVMNRVFDYGEPSDLAYINRFARTLQNAVPDAFLNAILEHKLNTRFDHARFALKPSHRLLDAHVTVNDELPNRIISGTVMIKSNIARLTDNGVVFDDGTFVDRIDTIIMATGYSFDFAMIESGQLIPVNENRVRLYKNMYPPDLAHKNTLAVIGLIQPFGSIMPISEMQARVFCHTITGRTKLPDKCDMLVDIAQKESENEQRYVQRRRHTIQVGPKLQYMHPNLLQVYYLVYMDELARLIDVKPKISRLLLSDPALAWKLYFHGAVPYQYRLRGTHRWSGARDAIMGVESRVFNATKTRMIDEEKISGSEKQQLRRPYLFMWVQI